MRACRFLCVLVVLIALCVGTIPAHALSLASPPQGVISTGLLPLEANSPLQVDTMQLTLDIPEFPEGFNKTASFLAYRTEVTATYTIQNPGDEVATATLLFPFGDSPDYVLLEDTTTGEVPLATLANKHTITLNGELVTPITRHAEEGDEALPSHLSWVTHWHEYTLTLQPGETVTLSAAAPLYPTMSIKYKPKVYTYTHQFYTAGTWMEPGKLTVIVNTPYYRTEGIGGYEKTDTGYTTTFLRLPGEEITFSLSSVENPTIPENSETIKPKFVFPIQLFGPVAAIAGVLLLIFIIEAIIHRMRKEK